MREYVRHIGATQVKTAAVLLTVDISRMPAVHKSARYVKVDLITLRKMTIYFIFVQQLGS